MFLCEFGAEGEGAGERVVGSEEEEGGRPRCKKGGSESIEYRVWSMGGRGRARVDRLISWPVGQRRKGGHEGGDSLEARRLRGSVEQNETALVDTLTSWPVDKSGAQAREGTC